jgi:hypothetical protein
MWTPKTKVTAFYKAALLHCMGWHVDVVVLKTIQRLNTTNRGFSVPLQHHRDAENPYLAQSSRIQVLS